MPAWNGLTDGVLGVAYTLQTRLGHRVSRIVGRLGRTRAGAIAMGGEFALPGELYKRAIAPTDSVTNTLALGGARTIETQTPTQLSEANFITDVNEANAPASYPTDRGGNGGGGKLVNGWHLGQF